MRFQLDDLSRIPNKPESRRAMNFAGAEKYPCRLLLVPLRCQLPEILRTSSVSLRTYGPRILFRSRWGPPHVVLRALLPLLILAAFRPIDYLRVVSPVIRRRLPSVHVGQ